MRGLRNEVRRARCLPTFRYPEVAPVFGLAEMELYGMRGGVPHYVDVARSRSPHLWPQRGCLNRCAWVCVLARQKSGLSQRANSGVMQPVAVATPPIPPTLSKVSPPSRRRVWAHNIAAIASRSSYLGVHGVVLLLPVGLPVAVPALEECVAARTDGGEC